MIIKLILIGLFTATLAGCATYKTTLTDAQGRTLTCEASGKSGLLTGYYLRSGFDNCVAKAEAQGYGTNPSDKDSKTPNIKVNCPEGYTCTSKNN